MYIMCIRFRFRSQSTSNIQNMRVDTQEIDSNERKYQKEEEELAEIDKPPKTDEFWYLLVHCT